METYSVDIDRKRSIKGSESYQIWRSQPTLNGNIMFSRIKYYKLASGVNETYHNFLFGNFK